MALIPRLPAHGRQRVSAARCTDCGQCRKWPFTRIEPDTGVVDVRAPMLDDAIRFAPLAETCRSEALSRAQTGMPRSGALLPPVKVYPTLVAGSTRADS